MAATLSLAMIVKDEAEHLAECVKSVRDVIDEVCIVDTGSRDNTLEVARQLNARIGVFIWCDDFAAARNESIRLCSKDWIFVLDADERLDPEDLSQFRGLTRVGPDCCYRFTTRNYTNDTQIAEFQACPPGDPNARGFAGWFPSAKVRLFPNRRGVRFDGKVHELVNASLEQMGVRVLDCSIPIHHYPLVKSPERVRQKQEFYLQLGHEKIAAAPNDPKAHVELGNQYAEVRDWANAAAAYAQALKLAPSNAAILRDLGGALHMLRRDDEARKALTLALELDPGCAGAWRNLGVVLVDAKEWERAVECFSNALKYDPAWKDGHRYLSVALEGANRLSDAAQESQKALDANPACQESLRLYIHQMLRLGRRTDARAFLQRLIARGFAGADVHNALGELYFYDNLFDESKEHFLAAGDGGLASAYNNLGVVYFKQGMLAEAKAAFEKCLRADSEHPGAKSNLQKVLTRLAHV